MTKYTNTLIELRGISRKLGGKTTFIPQFNDEPRISHYVTSSYSSDEGGRGLSLFDRSSAEVKSIAEFLERASARAFKGENKIGTYQQILTTNNAINPLLFTPFHRSQLKEKHFERFVIQPSNKFRWAIGRDLIEDTEILVPLQLACLNKVPAAEPIIRFPDTNGLAFGKTISETRYRGLLEIIERDALITTWLAGIRWKRIRLSSLPHQLKKIIVYLNKYKLKVDLYDVSLDFPPSVCLALISDLSSNPTCYVSLGSKASGDPSSAILGSIEEALQSRHIGKVYVLMGEKIGANNVQSYKDHVNLWAIMPDGKDILSQFSGEETDYKSLRRIMPSDINEKVKQIVDFFGQRHYKLIEIDVSAKEILKHGFRCLKILSPDIQPFFANEKFPYLGGQRLLDFKDKHSGKILNSPHPFP